MDFRMKAYPPIPK